MVKIRTMEKSEAQQTRTPKAPGVRRQRMHQFDEYVDVIRRNSDEAVVFEELEEPGQRFVLSLRGALKRGGLDNAVVRKLRARDEVRVWLGPPPASAAPVRRGGRQRKAV